MEPYYSDDLATLYLADSREESPHPEPASVIVADPPYASAAATTTTGRGKQTWGGNWGDMSLVDLMAQTTLNAANLTPEHEVYWFADHLSYAALVPVFFRRYTVVQSIVWDKEDIGMGAYYRRQTEFVLYLRTRNAPEFRSKSARDILRHKPVKARVHPAEKPVPLVVDFLRNTAPGLVLDPYAGSCTTLLAAAELGRPSVGFEVEERHAEVGARRLQTARDRRAGGGKTKQAAVLEAIAAAESVDTLRELARSAMTDGLWCDEIKTAFTARRIEIEGEAA